MTQILQNGIVNPVVPDAYINVVTPNNGLIVGAPTNVLGVVGVASWGPVNQVGLVGSNPQAALLYGNPFVRSHDISTAVAVSILQGALNMKCVRVSDGTDVAAVRKLLSTNESTETATITGTITAGDVCTITATGPGGVNWSIAYTTLVGDTTTTIVNGLFKAANNNPIITGYGFSFKKAANVLTIYGILGWTFVSIVSGAATEIITLAVVNPLYETGTIGGTVTGGDTVSITGTPSGGTAWTISYTVPLSAVSGGSSVTLDAIASALAYAGNTNPVALAAGFTFDSTGSIVDIFAGSFTGWTFSSAVTGAATETVTLVQTGHGGVTEVTLTSKYTGTLGNQTNAQRLAGSAVGTLKLVISMPGYQPEVFDNIAGPGNLFWANAVNAINNGQSGVRGPSQLVVASLGNSGQSFTTADTKPKQFAGGTDGDTGVGTTQLMGSDSVPRTGIYVLRGSGCSVLNVVDLADQSAWPNLSIFGAQEGIFTGDATIAGDTITNAVTTLTNSGVDTAWFKPMLGDWCYWYDTVNGVQRLLSPITFWAGKRVALGPQFSTLNQQISGIVGTQKSASGIPYTTADLQTLIGGRLDVICNPAPGGPYFACRSGRNSSSNPAIRGENYTMVTDFLTASIGPFAGRIVGQLQNPSQRRSAKSSFDAFFAALSQPQPNGGPPVIGTADGSQPWQVLLNNTNNPANLVSQGFEVIGIKVVYQSVIEYLVVNLEGGQTVQIQRTTTTQ